MTTPGALAGLVIVETAERPAGEYAARLLADLGARVVKIERPGGAPTRHMAPIVGGESALFGYLNTNKSSRVADLATAAGQATLAALLASAHALIDDHEPGWATAHGLGASEIAAAHPHLVHCAITPFGQAAPEGWNHARPLNVINAGGWAWHTPSDADPAKPPLKGAGRFMSDYEAGIDAAIATLAALHRQRQTGTGQFIDIAEVVTQLNRNDGVLGRLLAGEDEPNQSRTRYDMGGPGTSFACADGHLYLFLTTKVHWRALCQLMDEPDWTQDFPEDWLEFGCTRERVLAFRQLFGAWAATQPKLATSEAGQKLGLTIVPVNTAADLPRHPQFAHRGYFQPLAHPLWGQIACPTVPYRLSATPARIATPAPALGMDAEAATAAIPRAAPASNRYPAPDRARGGPLAGVRVLEIAKVWAGPYAGKLLAQLGAEVIKLESRSNLDEMRAYGGVDIDSAPYFLSINQEVRSVTLNMKTPEGMSLLRELIAASDIVLDNIRPGAMERSQLAYSDLRAIREDIIQLSLKMWGTDGPLGWQTGYAPCFAALAGLTSLVGHAGETPRGMNIRYGDSTAGAYAALAALAALRHRDATGQGQFIDVSAVESLTSLIGDALFAWSVTGDVPMADGNAHADMAPHGAYPCAGDEWLSIAVGDEAEWRALCRVLAADQLAGDPRFATLAQRLTHTDALDAALGALTAAHDATALAEVLRAAGVPAFKSASSLDLVSSDYLWAMGAYRMVSDARHGTRPVVGPSWRMTPDEAPVERGAPLLGEANAYVYQHILGLSEARMAELVAGKIID
jgi:crotonobetainyl-CoA:carnitine CoA-transferase CaiB-like acyl-CoA transferase